MKRNLILILMVVLASISCKNRSTETEVEATIAEVDSRGYIVNVGDTVPDFSIDYLDGKSVMLSELKGKLVMIQFTASWCGVCRKEMPHIEDRIWKKHSDNPNFVLVGIDFKEDSATTSKFAKDMNITYPLTLDTDGQKFFIFCGADAGVTRNIIVNPDGKIILLTRLFEEEEFNSMVELIDSELNKLSSK